MNNTRFAGTVSTIYESQRTYRYFLGFCKSLEISNSYRSQHIVVRIILSRLSSSFIIVTIPSFQSQIANEVQDEKSSICSICIRIILFKISCSSNHDDFIVQRVRHNLIDRVDFVHEEQQSSSWKYQRTDQRSLSVWREHSLASEYAHHPERSE